MQRFLPALLLAGSLIACGGGDGDADAGPVDAPGADAAVDGGLASCQPAATVDAPETYDGSLDGSGADFAVVAGSCAEAIAPFGVAAEGPDEVIAVRGLTGGTDYVVRLVSSADLAFYVAAGCAAGSEPAVDECLLFVDGSTGALEVGRFTAPANGEVVVVVDHWEAEAPADGSFQLELYQVLCEDDDDCTGAAGVCEDYRCAACATDFDCDDPATPICDDLADICVPGANDCVGDDPSPPEDGDDGPAGARDITPSGAPTVTGGAICNAPLGEYDFYRFDVATSGESYDITLDWADAGVDLDMQVLDSSGNPLGLSLFERPETIALRYLPAGRYYVQVNYSSQNRVTTSVPYTVTADRTTGGSCGAVADCASEYRNQFFRSICTGGGCEYRIGDGSLAAGAVCDTSADCASGHCAAFPFTANADTRSVCTESCTADTDCAGLGAGWVCTTYLSTNVCVQPCTSDQQCPISFNVVPQTGPWFRLSCNLGTGKCEF